MLESARWDKFARRADDIVISTSYKGGTTWTQTIVGMLVFGAPELPKPLHQLSPWIDAGFLPPESVDEITVPQTHRRFLKSHLPLDAVPYDANVKYIFVARDARDVVMSLWNHFNNYSDVFWTKVNAAPWNEGQAPHPPLPDSFETFYTDWISRSWFEWESDGWPYWSHFYHARSWWDYRHLPNILVVHYNDLLADLRGEIGRIADYLDIRLPGATLDTIADATTFSAMKSNAAHVLPSRTDGWRDHTNFFHKGVNGRWQGVLREADLALYDQAAVRTLTPDLRTWMESGGHV